MIEELAKFYAQEAARQALGKMDDEALRRLSVVRCKLSTDVYESFQKHPVWQEITNALISYRNDTQRKLREPSNSRDQDLYYKASLNNIDVIMRWVLQFIGVEKNLQAAKKESPEQES